MSSISAATPTPTPSPPAPARQPRSWLWPLLVAVVATIPVSGVFTVSRTFFLRDLTLAFHSRYLWLRHTVFAGQWPWWDPFPAAGQPAAGDALYQIFHPITLAIRLLLPELIAFNLWVALPVPLAGLGAYLYLRRHVSPLAAALGAISFAGAGPIVSMTNFPNLSWSVAALPYVFWAIDRVSWSTRPADTAVLAGVIALQALAGEPVTLGATLALAALYTMTVVPVARSRFRSVIVVAAGATAGLLLAAIQLVPLWEASRNSVRGARVAEDFWSFHPLALVELLVPHFFGDYFNSFLRELPWMVALNSGREPFYYTMYLGVPVILIAAAAALTGRRMTTFWGLMACASLVAALGAYTPIYPALQAVVPPLKAFRFPVKYLALASFAVAVLAGHGWQALIDGTLRRRGLQVVLAAGLLVGCAAYLSVAWLLVAPRTPVYFVFRLAQMVHVRSPIQGAEWLIFRARPLLTALFLKLLCSCFLLWAAASARQERRLARVALGCLFVVDLLMANSSVNPTMDASLAAQPKWVQIVRSHPEERVYVGGRLEGWINPFDVDAPKWVSVSDNVNQTVGRYITVSQLVFAPSGLGLRETISYDLPLLWPLEYTRMIARFKDATRPERLRFLARTGVGYCILPSPPFPDAVPLAALEGIEQLRLYECNPAARRVAALPDALRGPDVGWQIEGLFQERFNPASGVLVSETPPAAAGVPGPPVPALATILEDAADEVVVRAGLPADGYLLLLDSYDPSWDVSVDGARAPLMRANGLFRAVHLTRGQHTVRFFYRPQMLYAGARVSLGTALALALWCMVEARRRRPAPAASERPPPRALKSDLDRMSGFTLIELMIVMAIIGILLGLAFAHFRGAHAAGDESSAIASLRSIAAAQWAFAQTCGNQKYASTLPSLGMPVPSTGEGFLSPDLTSAEQIEKSGYVFQITAKPLDDPRPACNGAIMAAGYAATADPVKPGSTGSRFFGVNADRVLYTDSVTFTGNLPESGAPSHGTEVR